MKEIKTYAWYFPNWHVTPLNEKWHGKGWTEWECIKAAKPRFEGHQCPRTPLWGYEDESDPKIFSKKIQTAYNYGINGFIFDFYWFKETGPYRIDALNKGFLQADNNELLEFSIMWPNHDPIYVHPASYLNGKKTLLSGSIDAQLMHDVTQYCIDNYFGKPNYQRVDGKVYFGFWNTTRIISDFGGVEGAALILNDFRRRAAEKGFEVHLAVNRSLVPGIRENDYEQSETIIQKLGIDSVFTYSWAMPECKVWPKMEYSEYRDLNVTRFAEEAKRYSIPHDITVSTGWDCNPRTVQSDGYEADCGYPYSPIVINNTPEEVEKSFAEAKKFLESDESTSNMLTIATWNEWTEGNFMEPDNLYGYGYLEAFQRVFGKKIK